MIYYFIEKEPKPKKRSKREEQKVAAMAALTRIHGIASVKLRLSLLFAGTKSITERLGCKVNGIEDLMVTVSLDKPLLSTEQTKELNPMVIKLCSVSDLPNKPLSYEELNEKYGLQLKYIWKIVGIICRALHFISSKDHLLLIQCYYTKGNLKSYLPKTLVRNRNV